MFSKHQWTEFLITCMFLTGLFVTLFLQPLVEYHVNLSDSSWKVSVNGLTSTYTNASNGMLTLTGTFSSPTVENMTYEGSVNVDPSVYTTGVVVFKTDAPIGAGFALTFKTTDGSSIIAYGTAYSKEWTSAIIDVARATQGRTVSAVGIMLTDMSNKYDPVTYEVSNGTYSIYIKEITFYSRNYASTLLSVILFSCAVLLLLVRKTIPLLSSSMMFFLGATAYFLVTLSMFVIPFVRTEIFQILSLVLCVIALIGPKLVHRLSKAKRILSIPPRLNRAVQTKTAVSLMLGFVVIPFIALSLTLYSMSTVSLFDDELSYGLYSWGLSNGRFVGLNLATSKDPAAMALLQSGVFKVEPWPSALPIPFLNTIHYPNFTIVEPFFAHPPMMPLLMSPFVNFFGFNLTGMRLVFVLMNLVTVVMIFLIGKQKNVIAGLMGSAFFAVSPYVTYYSSKAFLDNGVAFFLMLSVYSVLKYSSSKREKFLYISAVFAGISFLSKLGALYAPLFLIFMMIRLSESKKRIVKVVGLMALIASVYPLVGLLVSWQGFLLSSQYSMGVFLSIQPIPSGDVAPALERLFSMWNAFFWTICFAFALLIESKSSSFDLKRGREIRYLALALPIYFLLQVTHVVKEWYFVIVMPILAIGVGYLFYELINREKIIETIIFYVVFWGVAFNSILTSYVYYYIFPVILASFLVVYVSARLSMKENPRFKHVKKYLSYACGAYLCLFLAFLVLYNWSYMFWA